MCVVCLMLAAHVFSLPRRRGWVNEIIVSIVITVILKHGRIRRWQIN